MDQRPIGSLALQLLRRLGIAMVEVARLGRVRLERDLPAVLRER